MTAVPDLKKAFLPPPLRGCASSTEIGTDQVQTPSQPADQATGPPPVWPSTEISERDALMSLQRREDGEGSKTQETVPTRKAPSAVASSRCMPEEEQRLRPCSWRGSTGSVRCGSRSLSSWRETGSRLRPASRIRMFTKIEDAMQEFAHKMNSWKHGRRGLPETLDGGSRLFECRLGLGRRAWEVSVTRRQTRVSGDTSSTRKGRTRSTAKQRRETGFWYVYCFT